jgi:hypothetical protein
MGTTGEREAALEYPANRTPWENARVLFQKPNKPYRNWPYELAYFGALTE